MTEYETPTEELVRTATEASNDLYYVRTDGAYRVPTGVMQRLKAALQRFSDSQKDDISLEAKKLDALLRGLEEMENAPTRMKIFLDDTLVEQCAWRRRLTADEQNQMQAYALERFAGNDGRPCRVIWEFNEEA